MMQPGRRNPCLTVILLHGRLFLDAPDICILLAGSDMKIRAQAGILLQPELIVGLQPVNLAVLE